MPKNADGTNKPHSAWSETEREHQNHQRARYILICAIFEKQYVW